MAAIELKNKTPLIPANLDKDDRIMIIDQNDTVVEVTTLQNLITFLDSCGFVTDPELTTALLTKADVNHTHTIAQVDGLQANLTTFQTFLDNSGIVGETIFIGGQSIVVNQGGTGGGGTVNANDPRLPDNVGVGNYLRISATDGTLEQVTIDQLKVDLSIENVDNTSDANKPVSILTQVEVDRLDERIDNLDFGDGTTDLTAVSNADSVEITSSTGTNATISQASTTSAGVMSNVDKSHLDSIEENADVTDTENVHQALGITSTGATDSVLSQRGVFVPQLGGGTINITGDNLNVQLTAADQLVPPLAIAVIDNENAFLNTTDAAISANLNSEFPDTAWLNIAGGGGAGVEQVTVLPPDPAEGDLVLLTVEDNITSGGPYAVGFYYYGTEWISVGGGTDVIFEGDNVFEGDNTFNGVVNLSNAIVVTSPLDETTVNITVDGGTSGLDEILDSRLVANAGMVMGAIRFSTDDSGDGPILITGMPRAAYLPSVTTNAEGNAIPAQGSNRPNSGMVVGQWSTLQLHNIVGPASQHEQIQPYGPIITNPDGDFLLLASQFDEDAGTTTATLIDTVFLTYNVADNEIITLSFAYLSGVTAPTSISLSSNNVINTGGTITVTVGGGEPGAEVQLSAVSQSPEEFITTSNFGSTTLFLGPLGTAETTIQIPANALEEVRTFNVRAVSGSSTLDSNVITQQATFRFDSVVLSSLEFGHSSETANVTVNGLPGVSYLFSLQEVTPAGWITIAALSATGGIINSSGVSTSTIVIPAATADFAGGDSYTRTFRLRATSTEDSSSFADSSEVSQSYVQETTEGDLAASVNFTVASDQLSAVVDVTSGDPPFVLVLNDSSGVVETINATAIGSHSFATIDTSSFADGQYDYTVDVTDDDGDEVELEFTFDNRELPPSGSISQTVGTTTPNDGDRVQLTATYADQNGDAIEYQWQYSEDGTTYVNMPEEDSRFLQFDYNETINLIGEVTDFGTGSVGGETYNYPTVQDNGRFRWSAESSGQSSLLAIVYNSGNVEHSFTATSGSNTQSATGFGFLATDQAVADEIIGIPNFRTPIPSFTGLYEISQAIVHQWYDETEIPRLAGGFYRVCVTATTGDTTTVYSDAIEIT